MGEMVAGRVARALMMIAALFVPLAAGAQERPAQPRPGCTGLTYSGAARAPVPRAEHPVVSSVAERSPAAEAGIRVGDVIVEVDGTDARTLPRLFASPPGTRHRIRVRRQGRTHDLELTAGWPLMALRRSGDGGGPGDPVCRPALPGISR